MVILAQNNLGIVTDEGEKNVLHGAETDILMQFYSTFLSDLEEQILAETSREGGYTQPLLDCYAPLLSLAFPNADDGEPADRQWAVRSKLRHFEDK